MTAAPPPRDSVLDTLGYAFGVVRKPGFLWAPMVLTAIMVIPLAALPGMDGNVPSFATRTDVDAYFRRVFRWLLVTVLLISIAAGVVSAVVGAVFGALRLMPLGQIVGAAVAAPVGLVGAIVLIRLTLLLSSPDQPPPPPPPLPDWMNPLGPQDSTGAPPAGSASAGSG